VRTTLFERGEVDTCTVDEVAWRDSWKLAISQPNIARTLARTTHLLASQRVCACAKATRLELLLDVVVVAEGSFPRLQALRHPVDRAIGVARRDDVVAGATRLTTDVRLQLDPSRTRSHQRRG
jgi:hypothetical protein